jgi:hypothetical protein
MATTDLTFLQRGKARFAFVRSNHKTMSIEQMAEKTGASVATIQGYLYKINAPEKPPKKPSKYDTWACRKPRIYLADNFKGLF